MRTYWIYVVLAAGILFSGCRDTFEYSPNQVFDKDTKRNINANNLRWLRSLPADDTITIAFVGDSQRFYDELSAFVDKVNSIPSVDFILLAGDISDFGLLEEFELVDRMLSHVNKPYFGVIGNHDVLAKGDEVFERMFGPLNFSFVYDHVKVVTHNTNGKEFKTGNVPDMEWLKNQLVTNDSVSYFLMVSHVPPFARDFDPALVDPYTSLFAETKGLIVSLHGHIHKYRDGYPYLDNVRYITTHSFDKKCFVLLKIHSGKLYTEVIAY
jgi:3',5'-cyclic-AMP phosphodiesterase